MQTTEKPKPKRKLDVSKTLSTRNGTLAVSGIAALIAAALLLVFLNAYRDSTKEDDVSVSVVVAKRLIERGSSADVLADEGAFQRASVPKGELKEGAVVDPATLEGQVALGDVYPGEQILATDFAAAYPRAVYQLTGANRAVAIPADGIHGNTAELRAGDHVDLLGAFTSAEGQPGGGGKPVIKLMMRDVLVLRAPIGGNGGDGSSGGNIVLKARDDRAAQIAYAADNGTLWILLRPQAGAANTPIPLVTMESVLAAKPPAHGEAGQ
jgi:Flp pilus assembly protein CpaB